MFVSTHLPIPSSTSSSSPSYHPIIITIISSHHHQHIIITSSPHVHIYTSLHHIYTYSSSLSSSSLPPHTTCGVPHVHHHIITCASKSAMRFSLVVRSSPNCPSNSTFSSYALRKFAVNSAIFLSSSACFADAALFVSVMWVRSMDKASRSRVLCSSNAALYEKIG